MSIKNFWFTGLGLWSSMRFPSIVSSSTSREHNSPIIGLNFYADFSSNEIEASRNLGSISLLTLEELLW